jgi:putative transposase
MAKRGHSEEAILRVLREAESAETVVEICRKHGISQQTFYLWKKKDAGLGLSELRELRQLREENGKLKHWWPICRSTATCCRRTTHKRPTSRALISSTTLTFSPSACSRSRGVGPISDMRLQRSLSRATISQPGSHNRK